MTTEPVGTPFDAAVVDAPAHRVLDRFMAPLHRRTLPKAPAATHVLIVDDEPLVRRTTSMILHHMGGYQVAEAGDAAEAVARCREQAFDLAVVDVLMPGARGDEVVAALWQFQRRLRVLYLTGYPDALFTRRPVLCDEEAFLEKPYTAAGLLEAVALALTGHL